MMPIRRLRRYAVFFDALGLPTTGSDREDLIRWSHGLRDRENDDPRLTPVAWKALHTKDYLAEVLTERRRAPREDLLTTLATAEIDGVPFAEPVITRESEIVGLAFVLFTAGVESTSALLSTAFRELALHPDQRTALVTDRRRSPARSRRLCASTPAAGRRANHDLTESEQAAGDCMMICVSRSRCSRLVLDL